MSTSKALIFGREPAAITGAIQATLALLIGFGVLAPLGLSTQTDLAVVMGVVGALAAVYLAYVTSETLLAPVVELVKAGVALGAIYGLALNAEQTSLLIATVTAVIGAWHRDNTSPLARPSFERIAPGDVVTPPRN